MTDCDDPRDVCPQPGRSLLQNVHGFDVDKGGPCFCGKYPSIEAYEAEALLEEI